MFSVHFSANKNETRKTAKMSNIENKIAHGLSVYCPEKKKSANIGLNWYGNTLISIGFFSCTKKTPAVKCGNSASILTLIKLNSQLKVGRSSVLAF